MKNEKEHKKISGSSYFDDGKYFLFAPDEQSPDAVPRFRAMGVAQQMSDGTFDFVRFKRKRFKTQLVGRCAHGRVSKLHDGAIRITLTFSPEEKIKLTTAVQKEMFEAIDHIKNFQDREFLEELKKQNEK
jgi:acylphosphatase